jgi:hypothetical protein
MKYKKQKLQQGGTVQRLNIIQALLGIKPEASTINPEESGYSYKRPMGNSIYSEIVKKIPYGNGSLISQRIITNPGTPKADTIYIMPSGSKITNPIDISRYKGKFKLLDSITNKKEDGGTLSQVYQQGGAIEEDGKDQLIVDFAAEYLKANGVDEADMVDNSGNIKEEYANLVVDALKEVDTPEFWEEFKKSPTTAVEAYIKSKNPEQVEYAKKGTKLKQLKNRSHRKCKCGCDLVLKKDAGGKIVEVCACGCKNKN